jgi:ariadne-1
LSHFKWDKEKLMERFYDGDQDQLFSEARVINPFRKPTVINRPKVKVRAVFIFDQEHSFSVYAGNDKS